MCLKVHWNHETPNQSLNCGTLGKRRRLWVQLPASLCSKAGNSDSDVDSPITQALPDGCFTIPWLEALHGLSWRLVPKPALSKPQAECHYRLSGVSRSWPTFTITVSASPAFHVAQWMLRVLYLQHSKRPAPNWLCSMPNRTMSDWESPWALSHHSPFPHQGSSLDGPTQPRVRTFKLSRTDSSNVIEGGAPWSERPILCSTSYLKFGPLMHLMGCTSWHKFAAWQLRSAVVRRKSRPS